MINLLARIIADRAIMTSFWFRFSLAVFILIFIFCAAPVLLWSTP